MIEEGVDVALRVRFPPLENTDLVMKRLAPSRQVIVAIPRLIPALHAPGEPEALASLPAIAFNRSAARYAWDLRHAEKGARSVVFEPRYVTDDMAALRLAAEDGVGVVQLPLYMVREQLRAGTLFAALPGWEPRTAVGAVASATLIWLLAAAGLPLSAGMTAGSGPGIGDELRTGLWGAEDGEQLFAGRGPVEH